MMKSDRTDSAINRIEAAMQRIDTACDALTSADAKSGGSAARVVELVNTHERLREQVAESLREIDDLLMKLEDER